MAKTEKKAVEPKVNRRKMSGIIVSMASAKTIKVRVEMKFKHPKYGKIIKKHRSFLVHNEDGKVEVGQKVWIVEGKPVSKRKKFYLVKEN